MQIALDSVFFAMMIAAALPCPGLCFAAQGELADSPAWRALTPLQQGSLMEGTALLSKQILGLEKKVR